MVTTTAKLLLGLVGIVGADARHTWTSERNGNKVDGRLAGERTNSSGLCDTTVKQKSGYFKIDEAGKTNQNYFYWMFESRSEPSTDPFILWMTGGPGCSGQLALLNENGPCSVAKDGSGNLATVTNPYSWTNKATVLWIDQPTGVGFSYGDSGDYDHDEAGIRDDMYHFLLEFFAENPEYAKLPFYVFGESYGGHFAPNVAYRVWEGNNNATKSGNGADVINLQGLAVGNGLTDPSIQYQWYAQMAYNNTYGVKSISEAQYKGMVAETPKCISMINKCQENTLECPAAQSECNNAQMGPYEESGLNPYDVRIKCQVPGLCYDFSETTAWLDLQSTRDALGVTSASAEWASCNMKVNQQFSADWMKTQEYTVPPLLKAGISVLIYAGDADFGDKAGSARSWNGFTFLQVNNAGHMVPMDQPVNALAMVETFISGGIF
eukprot:gene14982-10299_t